MKTISPIRWLHLSDFHIGMDQYETRKIFTQIHDHIRDRCKDGFIPNLIFITGDIACAGLESEYEEFVDQFYDPLVKILGEFSWDGRVFAVPGNHDLQRAFVKDVERNSRLSAESTFFRCNQQGREQRAIHELRAFQTFCDFTVLAGICANNWLDSERGCLVDIVQINGVSVGVACINTAWLSRDNADNGRLSPGKDLVYGALKEIEHCDLRLLLGHHPINWLSSLHNRHIENVLGDFRAIYIHGHLHEARVQPFHTGGGQFLQIQSGAAFQVMERDVPKWKNGIVWGEISNDLRQIRIQPRYWKADDRRWGISDDLHEDQRAEDNWWSYSLPYALQNSLEGKSPTQGRHESRSAMPKGWDVVDAAFLDKRALTKFTDDVVVHYFDGATPLWHPLFLQKIPKRDAVDVVVKTLQKDRATPRNSMCFLTGAGGEGKSTALLQSTVALSESGDWNVLWRTSSTAALTIDFVRSLPTGRCWLLVTDDADQIVDELKDVLSWVAQNRTDVHFLACARSSDWFAAGGTRVGWAQYCSFHEIRMSKLSLAEAERIVAFWGEYGAQGLRSLHGISLSEAAQRLQRASEDEEGRGEGAFLGAMLKIRLADGLRDHVKLVLSRLQERIIKGGRGYSLLDAFAAIAYMHAEGLTFLSAPVLAQYVLRDGGQSIQGSILTPLGKEAAASSSGGFIYTRHTSIAAVAVEVLATDFGSDAQDIFSQLGQAAVEAWKGGAFVPELGKWRYEFPEHFLESKRAEITFAISKAQVKTDPRNVLLITNMAALYRTANSPEQAVQVFRGYEGTNRDRGYYYEWGVAECRVGNHALGTMIEAVSLSDNDFASPPDNKNAWMILTGLSLAMQHLYDDYHNTLFLNAHAACCVLGLTLRLDDRAEEFFKQGLDDVLHKGASRMQIGDALGAMEAGIATLNQYVILDDALAEQVPHLEDLTFNGLRNLIQRSVIN